MNDSGRLHFDLLLPHVTPESVATALEGFSRSLVDGKDMDWLAMAVRRSLATTIPDESDAANQTGSANTRKELERLASQLWAVLESIETRSRKANDALYSYAFCNWDADLEEEIRRDLPTGHPLAAFKQSLAELPTVAKFLGDAAKHADSGPLQQHRNWLGTKKRRQRIERGLNLAGVFESAYGEAVTVNMGAAQGLAPSPFMVFYQQMVRLAFGEVATPDLSGVCQKAQRWHRQSPTEYVPGLIPGLPEWMGC